MCEVKEVFNAMKKHKKKVRKKNTAASTDLLREKGIIFQVKNGGTHLIVTGKKGKIDFWPSTGLFMPRYNQKRMRGVFKLLDEVYQNART